MRVGQVRRQSAPEAQGFEARLPMQLLLALATLLSVACTASGTCQPSQTDLATTLTIISSQQTKLQAQNAAYDGVVVRSPARKTVTRSITRGDSSPGCCAMENEAGRWMLTLMFGSARRSVVSSYIQLPWYRLKLWGPATGCCERRGQVIPKSVPAGATDDRGANAAHG